MRKHYGSMKKFLKIQFPPEMSDEYRLLIQI